MTVDFVNQPLELVSLASWRNGQWDDTDTSVHVDPDCGPTVTRPVDRWWGTIGDLDCVTCRVAARNQIWRRQESRA